MKILVKFAKIGPRRKFMKEVFEKEVFAKINPQT